MSHAPAIPTSSESLRRRGYRLTPQRHLVLRALERAEHHLSAEDILQHVQADCPGISLSTVYRTLEVLGDLDLVSELRLRSDRRVYELAGEAGGHCHLICRECAAITHARGPDLQALRAQVEAETRFADMTVDLVASGICPSCEAARSRVAGSRASGDA